MKFKFLKNDYFLVTVGFFMTRIVLMLIALISFAIFPQHGESYSKKSFSDAIKVEKILNQFDSVWFLKISREGYPDRKFTDDKMETWGFMPFYPILMRGIARGFNLSYFWTSIFFSNLFSLAGILVLYKLFKEKFDQGLSTIWLILLCAGSFYLSLVYAEGLFLLLTSLVFYFSFKKKYGYAFIFAGLATITRIQGCLLYIVPGVEILLAFYSSDKKSFKSLTKYFFLFLISLIPLFLFMYYLYYTCGEPLAFLKIQNAWGSHNLFPLQGFLGLVRGDRPISSFVNILFWVVSLAIVIHKRKTLPTSYLLFVFAYFLLSTSNEIVYGTTRYILVVPPIFLAVGASNKYIYHIFLALNTLFLALTLVAYITNTATFI